MQLLPGLRLLNVHKPYTLVERRPQKRLEMIEDDHLYECGTVGIGRRIIWLTVNVVNVDLPHDYIESVIRSVQTRRAVQGIVN